MTKAVFLALGMIEENSAGKGYGRTPIESMGLDCVKLVEVWQGDWFWERCRLPGNLFSRETGRAYQPNTFPYSSEKFVDRNLKG